ncbi:MAG: nucleotide exchange factor GrpE [Thermoanaerobacteraceae bacterium]|nr:nucleotide exchange factor GrpE [Thermoanaerobacteraceae bacterium]
MTGQEQVINEMPEKELAELRRELAEEKNRHLRTLADFDNYRRRVEREAREKSLEGKKALILDLLPVLDNLERAIDQLPDEGVARGLAMVYRQMLDLLGRHGLEVLESEGRPFNPEEHEGVGFVPAGHCPPGHVAREVSRGYRFSGEILRPARVLVARQPQAGEKYGGTVSGLL